MLFGCGIYLNYVSLQFYYSQIQSEVCITLPIYFSLFIYYVQVSQYVCVFASPPSLADQKFAIYMREPEQMSLQGVAAALDFNTHYFCYCCCCYDQ